MCKILAKLCIYYRGLYGFRMLHIYTYRMTMEMHFIHYIIRNCVNCSITYSLSWWLYRADCMAMVIPCWLHGDGYTVLIAWWWLYRADCLVMVLPCWLHGDGYAVLIAWWWLYCSDRMALVVLIISFWSQSTGCADYTVLSVILTLCWLQSAMVKVLTMLLPHESAADTFH